VAGEGAEVFEDFEEALFELLFLAGFTS